MAVVQRSEFSLALNQIASERGVDPQIVVDTIKGAILAAFRKDNPGIEDEIDSYTVELNENTGETKILIDCGLNQGSNFCEQIMHQTGVIGFCF